MIKHLALIAAGALFLHTATAQKYVDASTLTIIGRTCPMEGHPYYRVDTTRYHFDEKIIRTYCGYPAGIYKSNLKYKKAVAKLILLQLF